MRQSGLGAIGVFLHLFLGIAIAAGAATADAATADAATAGAASRAETEASAAAHAESEVLWLSGRGLGDTVAWDFFCTAGRGCGSWTQIPVPSQWELAGFGTYNYGHDKRPSQEQGTYRYRFRVPPSFAGRTVDLYFEGVMTDAEVWLNGERVGPTHQGGFYRFRYDVTRFLRWTADNQLTVKVSKVSANHSVNAAEREADYWIFGGIYRPVYLLASPAEAIDHAAIVATHDGHFTLQARLRGLTTRARLLGQIETPDGQAFGASFSVELAAGDERATLRTAVAAPQPWSAEHPHLYRIVLQLEREGELLHRRVETFGFRTVELRPGDGLYLNGQRIKLKGVNRHAFWPASGRTLNRAIDEADVALIRAMNLNAVRTAHYPPDPTFLTAADQQGLYVLDELAGWHDAYDTALGRRLVQEMVERDVNHPAILFWNNGNEGGWNPALDAVFHEFDPQKRPVLHPDARASGVDTQHYLSWDELTQSLAADSWKNRWRGWRGSLPLVMPTEILHGLYDGGSGAALTDFWEKIRTAARGIGLFLWSFSDESVVRTDRQGALDADGNHAPDGILGPYRELGGNFHAVRAAFSPIQLVPPDTKVLGEEVLGEDWDGRLRLDNHYDLTDLAACRFRWSWLRWPAPRLAAPSLAAPSLAAPSLVTPSLVTPSLAAPSLVTPEPEPSGELTGPPTPPGQRGELRIPPSPAGQRADALQLVALDPRGSEVATWVLPVRSRAQTVRNWLAADGAGQAGSTPTPIVAEESGGKLRLRAKTTTVTFDLTRGILVELTQAQPERRLTLDHRPPRPAQSPRVVHFPEPASGRYTVRFQGPRGNDFSHFTLEPSGWLRWTFQYRAAAEPAWQGVALGLAREQVQHLTWLGEGPARVWQNRLQGGVLGVWEKDAASTPVESAAEPKFEGFYPHPYWARLTTPAGNLYLVFATELYLGVFAPRFPADAVHAVAEVPPDGLWLLSRIPPIGDKFHPAAELGPSSQPKEASLERGEVWLFLD